MSKHVEGLVIAVATAFGAVVPLLLTSYVIILLDNLAAVIAAYKAGKKIESRLIRHTWAKIAVATISILAAAAVDAYFSLQTITAVKIIATAIVVSEFKSVVEHLENMFKISVYHKVVSLLHPNSGQAKRVSRKKTNSRQKSRKPVANRKSVAKHK